MFCVLGPEMGLGHPQLAGQTSRSRFSTTKMKDSIQDINQKPEKLRHRTLGSILSTNYDSVKSSMKRATSVRVTKRERKLIRAQDIFPSDPKSVQPLSNTPDFESFPVAGLIASGASHRATASINALSLDKPLPALPDEQSEVLNDILVPDFESYLDVLAYTQRDLPSEPTIEQELSCERESTTTPAQAVFHTAPKEEEWMSTRAVSRTSSFKTASASSDELRRLKSRPPSGAPTRCTSMSDNTVTPKSSRESEWGVRGGKPSLPGLGFASRIEEVSEPGTASPVLTPDRRSASVPHVCYHCGRDPTGKDIKDTSGTPTTVLEISKLNSFSEGEQRKDRGPKIVAEDLQGQRYALYSETSYFKALEVEDGKCSKIPKTPEKAELFDFSPPVRPSNPDPYASTYSSPDELPKQRQRAEIEIEDGVAVYKDSETTSPSVWTAEVSVKRKVSGSISCVSSQSHSYRLGQNEIADGRRFGAEFTTGKSFWKNPEGVILVYQGVEMGGKEHFYGSDINYLGSYYDDDEGSSGLGSTRESSHDLAGAGSGLAMIPEDGSPDNLWDDEAFDAC